SSPDRYATTIGISSTLASRSASASAATLASRADVWETVRDTPATSVSSTLTIVAPEAPRKGKWPVRPGKPGRTGHGARKRDELRSDRRRRALAPPGLAWRPQVIPDREEPDVEAVDHRPPQPAPRENRDRDGHDAEDDQVPDVVVLQRLLQHHVDNRPKDRPLDGANAADDHLERHRGGPLHAEHAAATAGPRVHPELLDGEHPAGRAAARGGSDEDTQPRQADPDAGGLRRPLVVADRGEHEADLRPQQQVDAADGQHRDDQRRPVGVGGEHRRVVADEP